jgi:hypothetical protein
MTVPMFCEKCGKKLLRDRDIVPLELDTRDNTYHLPELNEIPVEFSQGCFSFGKDCAKTILKNKGNIQ